MTKSLKESNQPALLGVAIANLALYYAAIQGQALLSGDLVALIREYQSAIPAVIGLAFIGILNSQVSPLNKARIVFFRRKDPLPGSRAFTDWALDDPRIDREALKARLGGFPTLPVEQNQTWFRLYKSVEDDPSVEQAHKSFLFTRDFSVFALVFIPVLGGLTFFTDESAVISFWYAALLIAQFLLVVRAAQAHGKSFVTNVLAVVAAQNV